MEGFLGRRGSGMGGRGERNVKCIAYRLSSRLFLIYGANERNMKTSRIQKIQYVAKTSGARPTVEGICDTSGVQRI